MERLMELLRKVGTIVVLVALFLVVVYFTNKRLFVPKQDSIAVQKVDLPLSRCTVDLDYDVFEDLVDDCPWAELDGRVLKAPKEEGVPIFNAYINENGMAEALLDEYAGQFEWDQQKGRFEMPKSGGYITVPTWILYAFLEDDDDD